MDAGRRRLGAEVGNKRRRAASLWIHCIANFTVWSPPATAELSGSGKDKPHFLCFFSVCVTPTESMRRKHCLLTFSVVLPAAADPSCSLETVRQGWDPVEFPIVFYADQNCPSEDGRVDDSAIWQARVDDAAVAARNSTVFSDAYTHVANKTIGGLQRPSGLMVAGGELLWVERSTGTIKSCLVSLFGPAGCGSAVTTRFSGLNCPQDFAIDYRHNYVYVLQYGGGAQHDATVTCGGEGRITRYPLSPAADGSTQPLDVVNGLVSPRFLALDPLYVPPGRTSPGILFWTDPDVAGGSVMRAYADGTPFLLTALLLLLLLTPPHHPWCHVAGTGVVQLMHLASPSGIAVDDSRQAVYVTQQVRGATLVWSSYDGMWQKHLTRESLYEPRGLAGARSNLPAPPAFHGLLSPSLACAPRVLGLAQWTRLMAL